MDENVILAKHLCGANDAITTALYKRFSNAETWEKGTEEGAVVQGNSGSRATSENALAEGFLTRAHGVASHSEGVASITIAPDDSGAIEEWRDGYAAHAEGHMTTAGGRASHTEGDNTVTNNPGEHAEGRYNVSNYVDGSSYGDPGNTQHSVGIGTNLDTAKNAFEIMQNGDAYLIGVGNYDGTNPEEATRLQDAIGGSGGSNLITVVQDAALEYRETEFVTALITTPELRAYKENPYRYNLIIEVHGKHESGELYGYTANHFCYKTDDEGMFAAMCQDRVGEGILHDTQLGCNSEGWFVSYSGFFDGSGGQALPESGSKVSVYLQKF